MTSQGAGRCVIHQAVLQIPQFAQVVMRLDAAPAATFALLPIRHTAVHQMRTAFKMSSMCQE